MKQNNLLNRLNNTLFSLEKAREKVKNLIHTSAVLNSSVNESLNRILELDELMRQGNEILSSLQIIKYNQSDVVKEDLIDLDISSYGDRFPWLLEDKGKKIDFNKSIKLFNGIKLVSNYLEKRYVMDPNLLSEVKITELLERFKVGKEVSVIKLFNHVGQIINKDSFKISTDKISSSSNDFSKDINTNITDNGWDFSKPFGKYVDITLKEIGTKFQNLKWEIILNNTQVTFNAIPIAMVFIGLNLIFRSYMKYVHNKPSDPKLKLSARRIFLLLSNLKNKLPKWVKLLVILLGLIMFVLKLLGLNILDIIDNSYYFKIYMCITSSLAILFQLLNLYLLHIFSTKKVKISEVLPQFLINWLKEFEIISSRKENIKVFKDMYYREIIVYILLIIFVTLIL